MGPLDPERRLEMPCIITVQDTGTKRWHLGFVRAGERIGDAELFEEADWETQREASDAMLDAMIALQLRPHRKPH